MIIKKLKYLSTFLIKIILLSHLLPHTVCAANPDAKRLYDDLLSNYNKLVRPVVNVTDALTVRIKLKLSQLIDVVSYLITYLANITAAPAATKLNYLS
jgi:hypothetical protein